MDYEPEELATFSPAEEDIYSGGDDYPAHRNGPEDNINNTDDFTAYPAEGSDMARRKRSQKFSGEGAQPQGEQEYRRRRPLQEDTISSNGEEQIDSAGEKDPEARLLPHLWGRRRETNNQWQSLKKGK